MTPRADVVIAERYRLETPLAKGGMGALWVAHHQQLDTSVAIKFITSLDDDPAARVRFEREARAAARLRSPHVVQVLDYGVEENTPYIVMELLEGESLDALMKRRGTLPLGEVLVILRQIVKALELAHAAKIVHRDLKPANVFASRVGNDVIFKILDFGIAADTTLDITSRVTEAGILLGSPYHVSPEQARGGAVDARSDLWSLGVVLFQMLTGQRPFVGKNFGDIVTAIFCDPVPRASALAVDLPPAFDGFFDRVFARNPDFRFQDAAELLDAFTALVPGGVAEVARAPSVPLPHVREDDDVRPRGDATRRVAPGDVVPDEDDAEAATRVSMTPALPPEAARTLSPGSFRTALDAGPTTGDSHVVPVAVDEESRPRRGRWMIPLALTTAAVIVIGTIAAFAARGPSGPASGAAASSSPTSADVASPAPSEAPPPIKTVEERDLVEVDAPTSAREPTRTRKPTREPATSRPRTPQPPPPAGTRNPFF